MTWAHTRAAFVLAGRQLYLPCLVGLPLLLLLLASITIDYFIGHKIGNSVTKKQRKCWLVLSLLVNLSILGFFKYYNFFVASFSTLLGDLGLPPPIPLLHILLPVGISFYTFHELSYVIDIYKERIKLRANNFVVLGKPADHKKDDSLLFNTPFHLNKNGVDIRTRLMISDVRKVLPVDATLVVPE